MSAKEQASGIYHMGLGKNKSGLLVPVNPLKKEIEQLKDEKAEQEAKQMLLELEKKKQEEINAKIQRLELMPLGNKVIILPYPENPYKKVMEGNIIVEYTGSFLNPDSGEQDKLKEFVACAQVIEIGPECKYLKPGDDVYYLPNTAFPVPFMSLGYKLTTEPQILCVLNESLKERFKME